MNSLQWIRMMMIAPNSCLQGGEDYYLERWAAEVEQDADVLCVYDYNNHTLTYFSHKYPECSAHTSMIESIGDRGCMRG